MRTPIGSFFLDPSSGDRSAPAQRLHRSAGLCDPGLARQAHGVARSPSSPLLLAPLHASRLAWTPATLTAWRFGRGRKAAEGHVPRLVSWGAPARVAPLPAPATGLLSLVGDGRHAAPRGTTNPVGQQGRSRHHPPWFLGLRCVLLMAAWDGERIPVGLRLLLPTATPGIAVHMPWVASWGARVGPRVEPSW
jgi:hypothetical protein